MIRFYTTVVFVGALTLFSGCASTQEKADARAKEILKLESLTQEMAAERAQLVSDVRYKLYLDVSRAAVPNAKDPVKYAGVQEIHFKIKDLRDTWLDFQGGEILTAVVNGHDRRLERGPTFVRLKVQDLVKGDNKVVLKFQQEFSRSGAGLHRFQDPEDGQVYLYTNFEPFDANRMAPLFDQPDLKAVLELTVRAPKAWTVIGNEPEIESDVGREMGRGDARSALHAFAPTKTISTYIFAMMAGPYAQFKSEYKGRTMRILARKSLAKYIPHREWFQITQQGFDFFEDYFGVAYPFSKYDQIVVPEFTAGAMENVGAVTFSERYVRRGGATRAQNIGFYNTVLHELAHMWFGNLVTMKWWNDLWLNESFATYAATLAQVQATQYKEAWREFRTDKVDAYNQDQSRTTHPISGVVKNTNEAFSSFDDITYGKGGAVLKQLSRYVGPEVFKAALQAYFQKHAYGNTTLDDFIGAFESVTKSNLKSWFTAWLETTGADTLTQSFQCEKNKITVEVQLSPSPRAHAFDVAAYRFNDKNVLEKVATTTFKLAGDPSKAATAKMEIVDEAKLTACPDFIYANDGDHGYFHLALDEKSLAFFEKNLDKITDIELKLNIWADLWQMVRDRKMKLAVFSDIAQRALASEKDPGVIMYLAYLTVGLRSSGSTARGAWESVYYFWPQTTPSEQVGFSTQVLEYEEILWERMQKESGDLRKLFLDAYLASVRSKKGVQQTAALLSETGDLDARWKILLVLCRENALQTEKLLEQELKKDKSDVAVKNALACRARRPGLENKAAFVAQMVAPKISYGTDELAAVAHSTFLPSQRLAVAEFAEELMTALRTTWPKHEEIVQDRLTEGLAPLYCDEKANQALEKVLASTPMSAVMRTNLLSRWDEDRLCVAVRRYNR